MCDRDEFRYVTETESEAPVLFEAAVKIYTHRDVTVDTAVTAAFKIRDAIVKRLEEEIPKVGK